MSASMFTRVGLLLTLIGACLLFFYGLPKRRIGNVLLFGVTAMKFEDSTTRDLADSEWQPLADAFWRRTAILNRLGFALVALGTVLQVVGTCL